MAELQKIEVVQGSGAEAKAGRVAVHYTGWLHDPGATDGHGKKFDSSRDRQSPFEFVLGAGQVIRGLDEGVAGMKIGETRRLIVPPDLGYGAAGSPPIIPANATLIFDITLVNAGPAPAATAAP